MATLPTLTTQNVGDIVKSKTKLYQPEGSRIPGDPRYENKPTNATPANIRGFLDELELYTQAVREAEQKEGLTADSVMAQWTNDMANWQFRLGHYYELLKLVPPEQANTVEGADAIYFTVTSPLLDGVYYEVLPGIVLSPDEKQRMQLGPPEGFSNDKPPDLYTPFTLGNQVIVYREHQRERWELLWGDLAAGVATLGGLVPKHDPFGPLRHALVTAGSGLLGAGVVYVWIQVRELQHRRRVARVLANTP